VSLVCRAAIICLSPRPRNPILVRALRQPPASLVLVLRLQLRPCLELLAVPRRLVVVPLAGVNIFAIVFSTCGTCLDKLECLHVTLVCVFILLVIQCVCRNMHTGRHASASMHLYRHMHARYICMYAHDRKVAQVYMCKRMHRHMHADRCGSD